MTFEDRDKYGMYKAGKMGPGPALMGADTLLGACRRTCRRAR
jgi:hypothetical protein